MSSLIRVDSLSVYTRDQILVEPLSFSLVSGKPLTILGETGAGKSLIAAALTGTLPTELNCCGDVYLHEKLVSQKALQNTWGRQIALLPQEPWLALDPIMQTQKQISEVHTLVNVVTEDDAQSRTAKALEKMNLSHAQKNTRFNFQEEWRRGLLIYVQHKLEGNCY